MNNAMAYSAQVLLLIAAGALLPFLFGIVLPKPRLWYWQGLLAVCLLLPIVQPRQYVTAPNLTITEAPIQRGTPIPLDPRLSLSLAEAAFGIYCTGVALRGIWLVLGCIQLWRYKRNATALEPMIPAVLAAQDRLLLFPDIRISHEISSPVTFGSVILLPESFLEMRPEAQQAIAVHELIHVQRRDWLFNLTEEIVRSIFWFHPAIWWLLAQIQLTREQLVDHATIALTQSREQYLDALLAVAKTKIRPDLALAPLFLKKRHLARRMAAITKEIHMSKRQIIYSLATALTLSFATATVAVWVFPLEASAQTSASGQPSISFDTHGHSPDLSVGAPYPALAIQKRIEGTVELQLSIDANGNVVAARVQSGPEELRNAARESCLKWHYINKTGQPETASVSVRYRLSPLSGGRMEPPVQFQPVVLKKIAYRDVPDNVVESVRSRLPLREGDLVTPENLQWAWEITREIDSRLNFSRNLEPGANSTTLTIGMTGTAQTRVFATPSAAPVAEGVDRVTVDGTVQAAKLTANPMPSYPAFAKQARLQGVVRLAVVISRDGDIANAQLISGHPLFVQPSVEALQRWRYQPTYLNGIPVEVATTVEVPFTLNRE